VQFSTGVLHYSTVQYRTILYIAEQYNTVRNNTLQYYTATACRTKTNQLLSCPFLKATVKQETEMHIG
jgi:hypothetical protein